MRRALPKYLLAAALIVTGLAKICFPPARESMLGPVGGVAVGIVELVLALMLFGPKACSIRSFRVAQALAVGGVLLGLFTGASCGCVGSVFELGRRGHIAMAATVGLLALLGELSTRSGAAPLAARSVEASNG